MDFAGTVQRMVQPASSPAELTSQEQALARFAEDGIAVARFETLFGEELWQEACADLAAFVQETMARGFGERPERKEDVIIRRFYERSGERSPRFSLTSPWLRLATSDAMLGIVNGYFNGPAWLYYLDNWFTAPYPQVDERVASQRWHRDGEDAHIVKVFVYFSDVDDEGAGPFEYVRSSAAGGRYGDLFRDGADYPPAAEFDAAVPLDERLTITGSAGTVIFCDTGGFHRGGFARTKPRVLSIATFLRQGLKKGKRRFNLDLQGPQDELSPHARFALRLDS